MAIKKFTKLEGWKNLDVFYGKKIQGVHMRIETFDRLFCRCGNTEATDGGIYHKCSKCGNSDFIEGSTGDGYLINNHRYEFDKGVSKGGVFRINFLSLEPFSTNDRTTVEYKFSEEIALLIEDGRLVKKMDSRGRRSSYYYIVDRYENNENDIFNKYYPEDEKNKIKNIMEIMNWDEYNLSTILNAFSIKENFEKVIESDLFNQYPNLGRALISYNVNKVTGVTKCRDFKYYLDYYKIPESGYHIFDYFEMISNATASYYRKNCFESKEISEFNELEKKPTKGWKIIKHYVNNHMLTVDDGIYIARALDDFYLDNPEFKNANYNFMFKKNWAGKTLCGREFNEAFKKEWKDLIPFYIKENILLKDSRHIVEEFILDIMKLDELGIDIIEENLKVKTMNYYLNKKNLADKYNLPGDKIVCFIDLFEKNPSKAIELIRDRRKITKKQLDAFLDAMD